MRVILSTVLLSLLSGMGLRLDPGNPSTLNRFQNDFLYLINKARTTGCKCGKTYMPPVEPLIWNSLLESSANSHAQDMYKQRYLAHISLSGKTIKLRIEEAGYTLTGMRAYAFGENIAAGQRSIDQVMSSWLRSEGHCKNIMSRNFKEIGVAKANLYWVQDFGMRVARN